MPKGDLHNPLGDALTDHELVVKMSWPTMWSGQDLARVRDHASYPALLDWIGAGKSPSAWIVAGPVLQNRLSDAEADDERPARYAVVRTVLDWYRTGIALPMPTAVIPSLLHAYLQPEIEEALQWAFESVTGATRPTSQSLLAKTLTGDAITVHDYIQDADARDGERVVPEAVWIAAVDEAPSQSARFAVGVAAAVQANIGIASRAWLPLATKGDIRVMFSLGVLLTDRDPSQARRWYKKAAKAGHPDAMHNLGALLADSHPSKARYWYKKAAKAGHSDAMHNLGALLADSHPSKARYWYKKAAKAGHSDAMHNLGALLADSHPSKARYWYKKAAKAGHPGATGNPGLLLADSHPGQAHRG